MRKVFFATNFTADGYCSHLDMTVSDELLEYFTGLLRNADQVLFGRTTYELMVPYWPDVARNESASEADKAFACVFDSLDKVVFSTTLEHVEGNNTRIARGNVVEELLALKQKPGKDISVGSLSIASQLSERGLIDEYRFMVHPVLGGKGPRLFDTVKLREKLRLEFLGSKTFQCGVVALHYRMLPHEKGKV